MWLLCRREATSFHHPGSRASFSHFCWGLIVDSSDVAKTTAMLSVESSPLDAASTATLFGFDPRRKTVLGSKQDKVPNFSSCTVSSDVAETAPRANCRRVDSGIVDNR